MGIIWTEDNWKTYQKAYAHFDRTIDSKMEKWTMTVGPLKRFQVSITLLSLYLYLHSIQRRSYVWRVTVPGPVVAGGVCRVREYEWSNHMEREQ